MISSTIDNINIPSLSESVTRRHKFKDISMPLVLVRKLCGADLAAIFLGKEVLVQDQAGKTILSGEIDPKTELYMISLVQDTRNTFQTGVTTSDITERTKHKPNSALTMKTVPAINWYHACLGYPVIDTWIIGIKFHWFQSWPGLPIERVQQFCTKKPETIYGHLKLQRQRVKSTKPKQGSNP